MEGAILDRMVYKKNDMLSLTKLQLAPLEAQTTQIVKVASHTYL